MFLGFSEKSGRHRNRRLCTQDEQGADENAYGYHPVLSDRALAHLVGQTSLNDTASARLGGAMADYHQARIDAGIKQYRLNGDVSTLEEALGDQSTTNGFFAGAASREIVEAAKRADRGAESGNRTLSFVASLIPYAGPVASYAVDEGKPIAADNEENAVDVAGILQYASLI